MPSALPDMLAFRRRLGADRWDEMWEGVLHLPPAPSPEHQDLEGGLLTYLRRRWARGRKCKVYHCVNLACPGGWPDNYRIPDLVLMTPNAGAAQKDLYFEGPPDVLVEIRTPGDETLEKLPFYAALRVPEVWILDRDTKAPAIYVLKNGHYESKAPEANGFMGEGAWRVAGEGPRNLGLGCGRSAQRVARP